MPIMSQAKWEWWQLQNQNFLALLGKFFTLCATFAWAPCCTCTHSVMKDIFCSRDEVLLCSRANFFANCTRIGCEVCSSLLHFLLPLSEPICPGMPSVAKSFQHWFPEKKSMGSFDAPKESLESMPKICDLFGEESFFCKSQQLSSENN